MVHFFAYSDTELTVLEMLNVLILHAKKFISDVFILLISLRDN